MSTKLDRKEIEALLPWYAAGTLDPDEIIQIEAALDTDQELRRQLELTREEMGEVVLDTQQLGAPSSRALEQLFARIEAEPARRAPLTVNLYDLGGRLADWFSPRTLGWAVAAAALAIAIQAGFLAQSVVGPQSGGATYNTASVQPPPMVSAGSAPAAAPAPAPVATGAFLRVSFQPNAGAALITKMLDEARLSIVDGPRAGGFYRLRIAEGSVQKEEIDRIAATLRGQAGIVQMVLPSP